MEPLSLTEITQTLGSIHQTQHQALIMLRIGQQCFWALLLAQTEDGQVPQSLVQPLGTPAAAVPHVMLTKMGPQRDPTAPIELFEHATKPALGHPYSGWSAYCCFCWRSPDHSPKAPHHQSVGVSRSQAGYLAMSQVHPRTALSVFSHADTQ